MDGTSHQLVAFSEPTLSGLAELQCWATRWVLNFMEVILVYICVRRWIPHPRIRQSLDWFVQSPHGSTCQFRQLPVRLGRVTPSSHLYPAPGSHLGLTRFKQLPGTLTVHESSDQPCAPRYETEVAT